MRRVGMRLSSRRQASAMYNGGRGQGIEAEF